MEVGGRMQGYPGGGSGGVEGWGRWVGWRSGGPGGGVELRGEGGGVGVKGWG